MAFVWIARYCSCGGLLELRVAPTVEAFLLEAWARVHAGPGHEPLDRDAEVMDQAIEELRRLAMETEVAW